MTASGRERLSKSAVSLLPFVFFLSFVHLCLLAVCVFFIPVGSIVMTTCSTVLALAMMPTLLYLYCQGFELENAVPYTGILVALIMTLVPCGVGIAINHWIPRWSRTIIKVSEIRFAL